VYRPSLQVGDSWQTEFIVNSRDLAINSVSIDEEGKTVALVDKPLDTKRRQCRVSGVVPNAAGTYSTKIPISVSFEDGTTQILSFEFTGLMAETKLEM